MPCFVHHQNIFSLQSYSQIKKTENIYIKKLESEKFYFFPLYKLKSVN